MTTETEHLEFQAEVKDLLDLMVHSLYTHREIFLRELVSNASDALDKRRVAALEDASLATEEPRIQLFADPEARTLAIEDNGVGMTREEVIENIGTIARSGTKRFLAEMKERSEAEVPALIGQFGVGFYSSFMVADEVVLETRKVGTEGGVRWTSKGDGSYRLEDVERAEPGTRITLSLKEKEEDDELWRDYTQEWVLREVVKRYSDFVGYPIQMEVEREEEEEEGGEKKTVRRLETLNSQKPLWVRPKGEIEDEEYVEFYHHLAHDWEDPTTWIHFRAEGTTEYTALLYLPKNRPFDLFEPTRDKSRVALYVRRVHIQSDCEELMPAWLRFVPGLVDSDDLPLNVSRETLQHQRQLGQIQKRLVRKVLDALGDQLSDHREDYEAFWQNFGEVLKEGLYLDEGSREDLAPLCLFQSTAGEELTTLDEYLSRCPEDQKPIYYLAGRERAALENSPHLEAMRQRGCEVLLFTDHVDEFWVQRLQKFRDRELVAIDRGDLDEGEEAKKALEAETAKLRGLLDAMKEELEDDVSEVRLSSRLTDSPVVLVTPETELSPNMRRILRDAKQEVPDAKRILELNPKHPLIERLAALFEGDGDSKRFADTCDLLFGQACLREGTPVPRPEHFAKLLSERMLPED